MRRIFIAIAVLLFFSVNQAAMAFEQCDDAFCMTVSMDVQKQLEHQKKDPACAAHCSMSSHHAVAMVQDLADALLVGEALPLRWGVALMPESTAPEGLIEPPSLV